MLSVADRGTSNAMIWRAVCMTKGQPVEADHNVLQRLCLQLKKGAPVSAAR